MSRTAVAQLRPAPGEVARGLVSVPGVDPPWELPLVVIRGREPGPTWAITSGVHAAEYVPIAAVTEFTRSLDPTSLRGTVIAVLIVNYPGFFERSIYVNPRDGKNINRVFPGDPQGSASERVAAFISNEVISGSDAYLDAHCGDLIEALSPFVLWDRTGDESVDRRSEAMARAFGLEHVMSVAPATIGGTSSGSASARGIPAITAEAGQQGICDPKVVERYVLGLRRLGAHLGLLDAPKGEVPPAQELIEFDWLRSQVTGVWRPSVLAGERVQKGQVVGVLRDLFGEELTQAHAGATGPVIFCVTSLPVRPGDPLVGIGVTPGGERTQ
ncbi:MAG: succinylglutamate desuccinylase/aspartoacylase family protein [Candidatus Dormibacteria bacterium]